MLYSSSPCDLLWWNIRVQVLSTFDNTIMSIKLFWMISKSTQNINCNSTCYLCFFCLHHVDKKWDYNWLLQRMRISIFYYFLLTDTCSLANCTKHVYVNYINKLTIKSWWYSILARSCLQSFPTYQHICYHLYKGSGRSFLHIQFQVNPTSLKINYQLFNLWFLFSLIRMVLKDLFEISASLNFFHGMALA